MGLIGFTTIRLFNQLSIQSLSSTALIALSRGRAMVQFLVALLGSTPIQGGVGDFKD